MTNREKAIRLLVNQGYSVEELIAKTLSELADMIVELVEPEWSDAMPELPDPPGSNQMVVGYWRVRNPSISFDFGMVMVEWYADGNPQPGDPPGTRGHFYVHPNMRGQNGGDVPELIRVQKLQCRKDSDGTWQLWGRADHHSPWVLMATGYEFAGWGIFPID